MSSVQQDLREILDALEERGFTARNTDGHYKIYYGDRPVMFKPNPDEDLQIPVTLPGTPSDARWRENTVAMLIRAKLLDDDPKKAGQRGLTPEDEERREAEREERERRQAEAVKARGQQSAEDTDRAAESAALRERASAVLGPLGVWKPGVKGGKPGRVRRTYTEAARVAFAWAEQYQIEPRPPSADRGAKAFRYLFEKSTVSDRDREWIEKFLDEVEEAEDPHAFYFGLLRELLGLKDYGNGEAVEPAPAAEPVPAGAGPEPLKPEDEDDLRIRDLREALSESRREADEARRLADARAKEAVANAEEVEKQKIMRAELEGMLEDAVSAAEAASSNGSAPPRIPEVAFEALGEMIGTHISVGGEEDIQAVLTLVEQKKERAVGLAKKIAAMELGIAEEV